MKLGIIARADERGIAYQTYEMVRHLPTARVLCVLMNEPGWREDVGRFSRWDTVFVNSNLSPRRDERMLDEHKVRQFLEGLDIVMAVETVYDWSLIDIAHEMGVKVIVVGNPEFYIHHRHAFPHPDRWVWPTDWMLPDLAQRLPSADHLGVLPVPTVERPTTAADPHDDGPLRVLHVVGRRAVHDRAGTVEFLEAIGSIRERVHVTITTQQGDVVSSIRRPHNVTIDVVKASTADRWELYRDQHVLMSPRKYGGLHLPALEALACGLTVVMPDCSPNALWPGRRLKPRKGPTARTPYGPIGTTAVHPLDIASTIDALARDRDALADDMEVSKRWAEYATWAELRDRLYIPALAEVLQ